LNYPLIRYADILLIYAEAQNESTLNLEAYTAVKMIRDRAGLTTPDMGSYNQATFRHAVWTERWHELSYEGITWFDMIRLHKVYNVNTATFEDFAGAVINGVPLAEKHY